MLKVEVVPALDWILTAGFVLFAILIKLRIAGAIAGQVPDSRYPPPTEPVPAANAVPYP